jgi:hypothetical protein
MKRFVLMAMAVFGALAVKAVVILCLLAGSCARHHGTVTVVNESRESIAHLSIDICGQHFAAKDLAPHTNTVLNYRVGGRPAGYDVVVRFASGRELRKEVGYVTDGFDFQDTIIVTDTAVTLGIREPARVRAKRNREPGAEGR